MLDVISKDQAVALVSEHCTAAAHTQALPLQESLSRVLAQDIVSDQDVPAFDRTVVDGFAVRAADTFGAGESMPAQLEIVGEILMGEAPDRVLQRGQCMKISTGGMLPQGADAAVMVEHTDSENGLCLVYKPVAPSENITKKADDIARGETLLTKGTVLSAAHIGILAALGIDTVEVIQPPKVAIISTGDEISTTPKAGQIRDINSSLLAAAAREAGCEAYCFGAVKDDREAITAAVKACLQQADMVLISGGSSAGARDMTVEIIDTLGEVYFHGIAMKPGKPTIFGTVENKAVFGLPGHPLAAYFVFRLIVCAMIEKMLGKPAEQPLFRASLSTNIPSNHGREEYLCVKREADGTIAPVYTKSGIISVLSQADGFVRIERDSEGVAAHTQVEVWKL